MLTAIATGGVLGGMNLNPTGLPTEGTGAERSMAQLGQNLQAGVARAVIDTAINGGSLEDSLGRSIRTAFIDTAAAQSAFVIGDMSVGDGAVLNDFTNKVAHAIAGCVAGAARTDTSGGCSAGAIGAAVGELAAEAYGRQADTTQFAAMMSAIAAAVTGANAAQINVASQAGANAAANNYLAHPEKIRDPAVRAKILAAGQECKGTTSCAGVATPAQAQVELLTDSKIAAICTGDLGCIADRQLERSIYVQTHDLALSRLDPTAAAISFLTAQVGKTAYSSHQLADAVARMQDGQSIESDPVDDVHATLAGNAPLFAAIMGISIIDGDSGGNARSIFRTSHYASRLESVGVNVTRAQSTVANELNYIRGNMVVDADVRGRLVVDGVVIEYRARLLADGTINVGTIFPVN